VEWWLELVQVPVSDVNRAKAFDRGNGWAVQQIPGRE
jgi:hypothetical protein